MIAHMPLLVTFIAIVLMIYICISWISAPGFAKEGK